MRGEFLPVWSETWRDIWLKLAKHPDAPDDFFSELYRELVQAFRVQPTPEALANTSGDPAQIPDATRLAIVEKQCGPFIVVEHYPMEQPA